MSTGLIVEVECPKCPEGTSFTMVNHVRHEEAELVGLADPDDERPATHAVGIIRCDGCNREYTLDAFLRPFGRESERDGEFRPLKSIGVFA